MVLLDAVLDIEGMGGSSIACRIIRPDDCIDVDLVSIYPTILAHRYHNHGRCEDMG